MKYLISALVSLWLCVNAAQAQGDYRVAPGDTLTVEVLEDPQLNRTLLVLPSGTVNFPFAGTIRVGGRTASQIEQEIAAGISGNFASRPTVFVTVAAVQPEAPSETSPVVEATLIEIFLLGEINSPGLKTVQPGTTLLQALSLSGGFSQFAATKRVQVRRTGENGIPSVVTVNFRALADGGTLEQDIILSEGDVILVPERRLFE